MTVTIANNDKSLLVAIYDPEHAQAVKVFYSSLVQSGTIWNYWITN